MQLTLKSQARHKKETKGQHKHHRSFYKVHEATWLESTNEPVGEKRGFPSRSNTNQPVQSQKITRSLKFRMKEKGDFTIHVAKTTKALVSFAVILGNSSGIRLRGFVHKARCSGPDNVGMVKAYQCSLYSIIDSVFHSTPAYIFMRFFYLMYVK